MKKRLKPVLYVMLAFIASFACVTAIYRHSLLETPAVGSYIEAEVVYVLDGDTIIVDTEKRQNVRVRLIGLDTPETVDREKPVQPYGREASDFTKERLDGMNVMLEYDAETHDSYGRDLCYVWIGDELFNRTLLENGYATLLTFPPNVKYAKTFTSAQKAAQRNKEGLWGL